jgi:hypothetical protein
MLSSNLDAKLEQHRARLAEHKEWLSMKSQSTSTPHFKNKKPIEAFHESIRQTPGFTTRPQSVKKSPRHNGVPIEDSLLSRGAAVEEAKEKLRMKKYQQEMEKLKQKKVVLTEDPMQLVDRFDALEKERTDRLERLKKMSEPKYDFKPKISKASEELANSRIGLDHSQYMNTTIEREDRNTAIRNRLLSQEGEEHTFAPKLNKRTQKIVAKMKERRPQGMAIEDYLERKELERQEQLLEMAESKQQKKNYTFTPRITAQAAQIVRHGSITERLYEESFRINEKKQYLLQMQNQMHEQYEFQPKINQNSRMINEELYQDVLPIHDNLLRKSQISKQRQQSKVEELERMEREMHNPRINPVSAVIASRLPPSKERLTNRSQSAGKRLGKPELDDSRRSKTPKPKQEKNEFTFKPNINRKSIEWNRNTFKQDFDSRVHQWHLNEKRKNEKLVVERRIKEEESVKECTFEPKRFTQNAKVQSSRHNHLLSKSFDHRNTQWEMKRKAKISKEQNAKKQAEVEECTFKPVVKTIPGNLLNTTNTVYAASLVDPLGFDEFVQRHEEARIRKAESEKRAVKATGSKWQNKLTVPKEFKFGQRNPHVKALDPIVSPKTKNQLEGTHRWRREEELEEFEDIEYSNDEVDENDDDSLYDHQPIKLADFRAPPSTIKKRAVTVEDDEDVDPDTIPPQGLFSSQVSVRILEAAQQTPQRTPASSRATYASSNPNTTASSSKDLNEWSSEWLRRSMLK